MKQRVWWMLLAGAVFPLGLMFVGDDTTVEQPAPSPIKIDAVPATASASDEDVGVDGWWAAQSREDAAAKAASAMDEEGE